MATRYTRVQRRVYPVGVEERESPEGRFWGKFAIANVVKLSHAVNHIDCSPVAPHDYAVTSGSSVVIYDGRNNAEKKSITRFKEPVYSATFRGDARLLAVGTSKGGVCAVDAATKTVLRTFRGHTAAVRTTRFVAAGGAGDAQSVLSSGDDAGLRLWDVATGACTAAVEGAHGDYVRASAVPPGGAGAGGVLGGGVVATGSYDHTLRLWDLRALGGGGGGGGGEGEGGSGSSGSDAEGAGAAGGADGDDGDSDDSSSSDGGSDDDSSSSSEDSSGAGGRGRDEGAGAKGSAARGGRAAAPAFAAGTGIPVAAHGGGRSTPVLVGSNSSSGGGDARAPRGCVLSVDHGEPVTSVAILSGGLAVLSAGSNYCRVWDVVGGGRLLHEWAPHSKLITAVAVDGTGSRLVSAGLDGLVKVADLSTFAVTHTQRFPGQLLALALPANNARFVVGAADGTLWVRQRVVRLGDAIVERKEARVLRSGSYRYFLRGTSSRAGVEDVVAAGDGERKPKLRPWDLALKAFNHGAALDAALASPKAFVTAAVMRELTARQALTAAVSGRTEEALEPLLSFLVRHITQPRYAALCADVTAAVADAYAHTLTAGAGAVAAGQNSSRSSGGLLAGYLRRIHLSVRQELTLGEGLLSLQGQLETLMAGACHA